MPISSTSTSVSSGAPRTVTGRPWSLLKLRSLAATRRLAPTAAATRSLVLVLPTLPVIPTTVASSVDRAHEARSSSAVDVSGTTTSGTLAASIERDTSAAPAPALAASPMKS